MLDKERARFGARADWLLAYVAEAHAQDEWPVASARYNGDRGPVCVDQPRTSSARAQLAASFARDFSIGMPVAVDPPGDEAFLRVFAPWPLRFYVVRKDAEGGPLTLLYKANPSKATYDPQHLLRFVWRTVCGGGSS